MTAQHNTSENNFFELFCAELKRFDSFFSANKNEFYGFKTKEPQATAVLCLSFQCIDFGLGLQALHTNRKSSSSQMVLLRSLLECVVRIKYLELFDEGFQNLRYADLKAFTSRYNDAAKAWPDRLKKGDKEPDAIVRAKEELKKFGSKPPKDFHKIEKLLAEIESKQIEIKAKALHSFYRELCQPAHSDLGHLYKRFFSADDYPFSCQSEIYECAAAWIQSAGHSLDSVMNRLRAVNA